jgi:5-methylthioadenosine/S-adenosylhomocysteine deaminase
VDQPIVLIEHGTVIAFDGKRHRRLDDGQVAFQGSRIIHVGRGFQENCDRRISAKGKIVLPGLISAHSHVSLQSASRLITDGGRPQFSRALFLNYLPTREGGPIYLDLPEHEASVRYGFASLLRHGMTTVVNFSPGGPSKGQYLAEIARELGIRLYYSPVTSAASYHFNPKGELLTIWDEERGLRELDFAREFLSDLSHRPDDLVTGIVMVDELLLATENLLNRATALACEFDVGLTLHAAEQVYEFHEFLRRYGRTPVEYMADKGVLTAKTLIAHCLMIGGHSSTAHAHGHDLKLLAGAGASVAHCPVVQSRRGYGMESYQKYIDAGVNVALGADTWPLDLFAEMRMAAYLGKLKEGRYDAARSMDIFNSATLGGAKALGRADLGRLAAGAQADIVIVNTEAFNAGPIRDPIQMLVHQTSALQVDTVFVAGRLVVEGGHLISADEQEILREGTDTARREWREFEQNHWSGARLDEIFPPAIESWDGQSITPA